MRRLEALRDLNRNKLCCRIKGRVGTFSRITPWLFEIFHSFLCSFADLRSGFLASITLWGPPTILDRFPEANASCSKNHNSYSSSKLSWAPERKTFKAPFSGHIRAIHLKLSHTTHSMSELGVKNNFARVLITLHHGNWREKSNVFCRIWIQLFPTVSWSSTRLDPETNDLVELGYRLCAFQPPTHP